jgi:hypothetical protein
MKLGGRGDELDGIIWERSTTPNIYKKSDEGHYCLWTLDESSQEHCEIYSFTRKP